MPNLKSVLLKHSPPPDSPLGGRAVDLEREQLRQDLLAVSNNNKSFFRVGVVMLVVLFMASLAAVWRWHEKPDLITAVFAGTGISISGVIAAMFAQWKEKTRTDMLLALLGGVRDTETLKKVIGVLIEKL